jgi:hypothetical protein
MNDTIKFRILMALTAILAFSVLAFNILQEYWLPDMEGYLQRRLYYERVISKKGTSLHKGMHWKGIE